MKQRVFIVLLCLLANFKIKAQCTPNFVDSVSTFPCGIVQFTNLSTPSNSLVTYSWNFGNSTTSTLTNPTATYTANGTYTVCLFMLSTAPSCSASICKTISISCFTASCTANFSPSSCAGGVMQFINTSPGTNSTTVYDWDLGNSTTSTLTNPTGTYSANGIYTVCLSYTTTAPAYCTATICKTVNINCVTATCSANFNASACDTLGQVSFSNTSSGTNSTTIYNWDFGNNTTSTLTNPIGTYTANGIYTVCLTYTTAVPSCSATICKTISINCFTVPACQANFTNSPCNNGQVTFWSTSTGTTGTTVYTWSNSPPPSGPPAPYTATVCLKIVNTSPACTHSVCKTILIDCTVGVPEFIFENGSINIFPNPSSGYFNLDLHHANLNSPFIQIKVYNILGELVHQSNEEILQGKLNKEIDLQYLPNGAYYLKLNSGSQVYSVKLIISK